MLDNDRDGIAWLVDRRIADEQGMVAFAPRTLLVLLHAAFAFQHRDPADLCGACLAAGGTSRVHNTRIVGGAARMVHGFIKRVH